mmetsp:Transcript_36703/g.89766  ORF Transcript_36703/g.89766 Transcript_36703/m.89766 type:complete len:229 (+) Transcript_36703:524-1210(+)
MRYARSCSAANACRAKPITWYSARAASARTGSASSPRRPYTTAVSMSLLCASSASHASSLAPSSAIQPIASSAPVRACAGVSSFVTAFFSCSTSSGHAFAGSSMLAILASTCTAPCCASRSGDCMVSHTAIFTCARVASDSAAHRSLSAACSCAERARNAFLSTMPASLRTSGGRSSLASSSARPSTYASGCSRDIAARCASARCRSCASAPPAAASTALSSDIAASC